jgi:hypothetical protein
VLCLNPFTYWETALSRPLHSFSFYPLFPCWRASRCIPGRQSEGLDLLLRCIREKKGGFLGALKALDSACLNSVRPVRSSPSRGRQGGTGSADFSSDARICCGGRLTCPL